LSDAGFDPARRQRKTKLSAPPRRHPHAKMKQKLIRLPQQYVAALERHLKQGPQASLQPALKLGRQAVALGLETLDLARIHDQALAALELSNIKNGFTKLARIFFTEANLAIEETHRAARQTKVHLSRLTTVLDRRTEQLAASNRQLQRGVVRRKVMEVAAEKNGRHHKQCLEESLQLQKRLRQLTHQVMAAQEDERKSISRELQNEIAQTLLGINLRLLSLKQEARSNTKGLKDEIASTQRLVVKSVKSVRRFARELGGQPPAQSDSSLATNSPLLRAPARPVLKSSPARRKTAGAVRATIPGLPASLAFPVIAMAASTGGLKALSVILGGLPADFPAAIAIVMHLAPDQKSTLAEILNSRSDLTVKQAQTGDILCRSGVFIAPPNHHLSVAQGGRLELSSSAAEKVHYSRPSAEPLFASVAEVCKKNAIAVVLTGGDGDGSFGVKIIKEQGGKVIAQDRPTSQDFSMPESSIKTGDVDFILPLDEIAPKLMELVGAGTCPSPGAAT
jgi:two-component system, chemotaxis family, protein-glutamate methylesterase/glutaminase